MKKMTKIATAVALVAVAAAPAIALASAYTIADDIGGSVGLGTADLKTTVINIISWVLGILALVAVVMIIWAGFTWMMAGGSEEKIEQAKKIMSAAVIGLIVVLLAWAIVIFVAGTTKNVTS